MLLTQTLLTVHPANKVHPRASNWVCEWYLWRDFCL